MKLKQILMVEKIKQNNLKKILKRKNKKWESIMFLSTNFALHI